jgi:hypothetical protein
VAGNESGKSPAINITIDTTAPTSSTFTTYTDNIGTIQSTTSSATVTDDTSPGINIGVGITDSPLLYIGGQLTTSTYNSGAGTLTPNTALSDGTYSFAYTLTDDAGNVSALSTAMQITVDTTAPVTPSAITQYSDLVGTIQNATSTATSTDATKPGFYTGVVENPNGVKLYVDGTLTASTYDNVAYTITPSSPLSEGAHTITYSVVDIAGNQGLTSPSFNITIDTTAPTTPSAPASYVDNTSAITSTTSTAPTTNDTTPGINIPTGLTDTVRLYANSMYIPATYTSGVITPNTGLVDGVYAFTYTLTDATGNESGKSPAINITIDTTAPTPSAPASYVDNVGTTTSNTSTASTTDDNTPGINIGAVTDTPTLYANNVYIPATYSSGVLTPSTALADNTYAFTYTLTDAAGNISGESPAINITINTVIPWPPLTLGSGDDTHGYWLGTAGDGTSKLIVAPKSTESDGTWGSIGTWRGTNSATNGVTNTTTLFNLGAAAHPVAYYCRTLTTGGYSNWYLPAKDELATCFEGSGALSTANDFIDGWYWSSTEIDGTFAASQLFEYWGQNNQYKDTTFMARAVRRYGGTPPPAAPVTPASAPLSYVDNVGTTTSNTSTASTTDDNTPGINIGAVTDTPKLYANNAYVPATYTSGVLTPDSGMADNTYAFTYTLSNDGGESGKSPAINITINTVIVPTGPFGTIGSGTDTIGYWLGTAGDGVSKLIVAPKSTEAKRAWGSPGTARGTTDQNNGVANTTTLYVFGSAAHPAAYYCRALTTGGYSNWYMPALTELNTCWTNHLATPFATSNAFFGELHWSSTETNASFAWNTYFVTGLQYGNYKGAGNYYVRPVRRSTL